jgi:protein O-mannosyl-transferase
MTKKNLPNIASIKSQPSIPIKKSSSKKAASAKSAGLEKGYFNLVGLGIIWLLGIIIYSNSFGCSWHFDDFPNIVFNPAIQNLHDIKAWWNFVPTRPLGNLTFALNYHFNGLDLWYYHLVNLLIHLINASLVGWFALLLLSSPALKGHKIAEHKKVIALFTALLFVSHPLATQSVTYIVQRLASLAAMFYLLSVVLYIKARLSDKGLLVKCLWFGGAFLSGIFALLTKENAFTLPFSILMIEFFFIRKKKFRINFKDYRLYLLITGIIGIVIIILLKFSLSIFDPIPPQQGNTYTVTPGNYLLTQFSVIVNYIQLLLLPVNQNMDYDFPIAHSFFELRTILCFTFLLGLFILAIFLYKKHRIISFGIFWFFLTLSIEASFIPIPNFIFEHRTYLPSVGYFLIFSSVIYILLWKNYRNLAICIFIIVILSNSWLTYERNKVWKDELSLWSDVVSKSPHKVRPYNSRGMAYQMSGQLDKAIDDYSMSIRINPEYMIAYNSRGFIYQSQKLWDKAIADYTKAIELRPEYSIPYNNRGTAYINIGEWAKAVADYSKSISIDPNNSEIYSNRGFAYGNLGFWDKAVNDFTKAIQINPKYAVAYNDRGFAYSKLGQLDKAIDDHSAAIQIDPMYTTAYFKRGNVYLELEQWDKAIADYSKVLEIDPSYEIANAQREIALKKLKGVK